MLKTIKLGGWILFAAIAIIILVPFFMIKYRRLNSKPIDDRYNYEDLNHFI